MRKANTWLAVVLVPVALNTAIDEAKTLLSQGQRRQAIAKLDSAAKGTNSKKALRELSERRKLFLEQFLTTENFQNFEEAKEYAEVRRWADCLRQLDAIAPGDRENVIVLRLRSRCLLGMGRQEEALKNVQLTLAMMPGDLEATFDGIEIAIAQKNLGQAFETLKASQPKSSEDLERYAILKARLLALSAKQEEAIEVLREDQEAHLEHIQVIYELGALYGKLPGHDWPARKYLTLFITRCKRLQASDLKARQLDSLLPQAQTLLAEIEHKLGV